MSYVQEEIASQPGMWRQAARAAVTFESALPRRGQRAVIVGCGTSLYMAEAWASAREAGGGGETDAFTPTETPGDRAYDVHVILSRSGTTTEAIRYARLHGDDARTVCVTGVPDSPLAEVCDDVVSLEFADERSLVQTRFATSALALLRAHCGEDIGVLASAAEDALQEPLPDEPAEMRQIVFLGHGMGVGVAREAALKLREAAGAWTEAYPATEFRHGPISAIGEATLVWAFCPTPASTVEAVRATGATWRQAMRDPMVELIVAQRLAVVLAERRGLDPDGPRHLTRSVILSDEDQGPDPSHRS